MPLAKRNLPVVCAIFVILSIGCSGLIDRFKGNPASNTNTTPTQTATATPTPTPTSTPSDSAAKPQTDEKDLLSLASGTVLAKRPKENNINPYNLIDGSEGSLSIWASRGTGEQVFVFDLSEKSSFDAFEFDTNEHYYATDTAARDVTVEVSDTSAEDGFQPALTVALEDNKAKQRFKSTNQNPVRWVRLTIKSNYGNADYIELGEIRGFGKQLTQGNLPNLSGTYALINDDASLSYTDLDLHLKQEGNTILGCDNEGTLSGGAENRLATLRWKDVLDNVVDNAVLTSSPDGSKVVLAKFKRGGLLKVAEFQKRNTSIGDCKEIKGYGKDNAAQSQIETEIEKTGRARIYGINFDFNSENLREESKTTLNQVLAVLKAKADWKMTIEGHTDNIGGESFNLALSERRAKAVRDFLVKGGIDDSRLESTGMGLSNPVASNDTEIGRAQNRRVELVKK